jgi:hypothetical protein
MASAMVYDHFWLKLSSLQTLGSHNIPVEKVLIADYLLYILTEDLIYVMDWFCNLEKNVFQ